MNYIIDYLKEGSRIHIKKSHRGRFTSYCNGKVTNECIARGKRSPSAKVRKMATFAANSRRWSHKAGGILKASNGMFINTGLSKEKIKEKEEKNKQKFQTDLNKLNSKLNIPSASTNNELSDQSAESTQQQTDNDFSQFLIPITEDKKTYSFKGTSSSNRDALKKYLESRGNLDADTIDALLVQAGAESGYNHQAKNPMSTASGLGQWIGKNQDAVINYINQKRETNYKNFSDLTFDDQAEALAWWYYDRNKELLDSKTNLYDKVKTLAKIGLGPAILSGEVAFNGKTYKDTDEDWLRYFNDTGHNPKGTIKSFDEHIANRFKHAGYSI